jgi:hypothetical protein
MKRKFIILLSLILATQMLHSQTFLHDYKNFRMHMLDSIKEVNINHGQEINRKWIKQFKIKLKFQIKQFDTIFYAYRKKSKFDFNTADSIIIIYQTGVESSLSDYIIYTGKDTISFKETTRVKKPGIYHVITIYSPFLYKSQGGTNDRDSLVILANNKDFKTAIRLSKENRVLDGASSTIIFAKRTAKRYKIEECFLQPFGLLP